MNTSFRYRSHEVDGLRGKALSAAAELLAQSGAEHLNLKAIAETAGIGISSMYHYFASKEDLLLCLAIMGFDDLQASIVRRRTQPDLPTPLAAGARGFFGFAQANPALFSVMFDQNLLARHETLRQAEQRTLAAFQSTVEADDRFPLDQKANIALALWALGRGMAAISLSQPGGRLPPDIAAQLGAGVSFLLNHRPPREQDSAQ